MGIFAAGFKSAYLPLFRAAGLEINAFFYGGAEPPEPSSARTLIMSDGARYGYFDGAYDPELDVDLANRVRARAMAQFHRTFIRASTRQTGAPPEWAHVHYHFENALNFYSRMLREREIDTVLFWIVPHEGNYIVLYHLAQELGLRTVLCLQAVYGNAFWIMEGFESYGLSPVTNAQGNTIPFDPKPDTLFYVKGMQKPLRSHSWLIQNFGLAAEVAGRAAMLQFLWKPYSLNKSVSKLRYSWRKYQHQGMNHDQFHDLIPERKFIYFPLHHQPELSADIIGRRYVDQTLAIEELRRAAPDDIAIYVKENPRQTSLMRGEAFFRRLADLPNVYLMRHYVSSLELSAQSQMLATVTGSAAYEALQMGKPVLSFGDAWFRGLPGVFDASGDADQAYQAAAAFAYDEDALRAAVADKSTRLWSGVINHLLVPDPSTYDEVENRSIVTRSLVEYLERSAALGLHKASAA